MRILAVTNMYPVPHLSYLGTFVEQQIKGLREIGLDVDILFVDRPRIGMTAYLGLGEKVRSRVKCFQPDIVHVMYGGVMADEVTKVVNDRPTVVTFHGSDLLGARLSGYAKRLTAYYGVRASWRAARRSSGIVTVAKVVRQALPRDIDQSKIRVIPCGIDLQRFKPLNRDICRQQLGWDPDRFHVVFPANSGNP